MAGATSRADASLGYNPLTYSDPTGQAAVLNLMPGPYAITDRRGFTIWINLADLKPLLNRLEFRESRKNLIWASTKKKAPSERQLVEGDDRTPTRKNDQ